MYIALCIELLKTFVQLQDLVKFLHGRKEPFDKLVELFHSSHSSLPKLHIKRKIQEVSVKSRHAEGFGSARWVVKPEVFESVKMVQPEPLEYTPSKKIKRISREHTETDVSAGKFCSEKVKPRKKKAKLAGAIGLDITSASPTADATFAVAEKEVVIAAKEIQRSDLLAIKKTPITKQIKKIEPQKIIPEKKKQGSLAHAFAFACVKNTETTDTLVGDNENVGGKVIGELVSPVVEAVCSLDKSEVDSQDSNPFEMADEKTVTTNKDMNSDLQLFDPACSDHLDGSLEADIVNTPGSRKCVSFSELAESKHFSSNEAVLQTKIAPVISVPLSKAQVGLGAQFLQDIEKASC